MGRQLKKTLAVFMSICCLWGCNNGAARPVSSDETTQQETQPEVAQKEISKGIEAETTEAETTEAQKKENEKTAILVVSFGTSYNDNRDITIGAIEEAVADAFSDYQVRRAFTSQIIIEKLKERDHLKIDNVTEALDRAVEDGIKELIVQPTHLMGGYEYNDILDEISGYVDKFDKIVIGKPLLSGDQDFEAVAEAITDRTASYDDGKTAICFMGHGTEADSNGVYKTMQKALTDMGFENYYIGTVEAEPELKDVMEALKAKGGYERVILQPLMVVAGDHANNDMAGDEADSWKTILEGEGYQVECILEGLGQIPAIRDIYVEHLKTAMEEGVAFTGEEKSDKFARELENGSYLIQVESSSSMFRVVKAELTVTDSGMVADITLGGTGYEKLYMGTAKEAQAAEESLCIPYVEDGKGAYTYTIPVKALDEPIDCAAFSKKKETWYDRQLIFSSGSAVSVGGETGENPVAQSGETIENPGKQTDAGDGVYSVEITFSGGSGKAKVLSPVKVTKKGDSTVANIQWNSPNYDYMLVEGQKYLPVNMEGNSVFEIPVAEFDKELTVIGDTVAMSTPHEVEYTLVFHSDTMKPEE